MNSDTTKNFLCFITPIVIAYGYWFVCAFSKIGHENELALQTRYLEQQESIDMNHEELLPEEEYYDELVNYREDEIDNNFIINLDSIVYSI